MITNNSEIILKKLIFIILKKEKRNKFGIRIIIHLQVNIFLFI